MTKKSKFIQEVGFKIMSDDNKKIALAVHSESESKRNDKEETQAQKITQRITEKMKKEFNTLNIEFRGVRKGDGNNISNSYLFDIWLEPLIFKQKPTTITLLSLDENDLEVKVKQIIAAYIDNMNQELEIELNVLYPGIKIKYSGHSLGGYMFQISCPKLIPPDGVSDSPATSLLTTTLSTEELKDSIKEILEKYKQ